MELARIKGGGVIIFFSSGMGGSSKIIVEVRGLSYFCPAQGSVKPVLLCSFLVLEIIFSFNLVINTNSSETNFTNYGTAFSNYPTFNWVIQMNH